jgi:hypothetical protein
MLTSANLLLPPDSGYVYKSRYESIGSKQRIGDILKPLNLTAVHNELLRYASLQVWVICGANLPVLYII